VLVHPNVERPPPEDSAFSVLSGIEPEPETAEQLQLFLIGEPRTELPELQPNDEDYPGDLLGMYYLG